MRSYDADVGALTPLVEELLARADAERAAGRGADAARLYDEAGRTARDADDLDGWAAAALGAASVQVFGAEPGRLPALLYDVLTRATDDRLRARLAAALARCWVYAGEAGRGAPFSAEALERARQVGDPALVADALDAALAVHWGPDELDARRTLARELDEVTAHLDDVDARLQAHLWALHVATEALDVQAMHRQMRALETLGEQSSRAMFFAASRRLMLELLRGRTDNAEHLVALATEAADGAHLADSWMVLAVMEVYAGIQRGETGPVTAFARRAEEFALAEGAAVVVAEAAFCWLAAGHVAHAHDLVRTFGGGVLENLPRDVNWMLTVHLVLEVAIAAEDRELIRTAVDLLAPYAGRAVVNAGAVMFHGTTDDTLARGLLRLGRTDEANEFRERALATYRRIGAQWWRDRLLAAAPPPAEMPRGTHFRPGSDGIWLVGVDATPVAALRGFGYLHRLLLHEGRSFSALELVGGGTPVVEESGLGETVDRQALEAYRRRLRDLDAEITEAEDWADQARLASAHDEREALLAEIGRATGLGGRPRTGGSSQERARVAVRKAISTAIVRTADVDPALAQHLRLSVRTGLHCAYEPEPNARPDWVLA